MLYNHGEKPERKSCSGFGIEVLSLVGKAITGAGSWSKTLEKMIDRNRRNERFVPVLLSSRSSCRHG
jgi:hypothetical protein